MDNEKSKFITFLVIGLIFLGVSGYYYYQQNPVNFSTTSVTTQLKAMRAKAGSITQTNSAPQLPTEPGRITDENCGLSFVLPEEWKVKKSEYGNRFCHHTIEAPDDHVAFAEVGVPGFLPRKNSYESFTWDDIMHEINSSPNKDFQIENITIAGVEGIRLLVNQTGGENGTMIGSPNVMYFFKKGESVFYVRYTITVTNYESYNQYFNRQRNVSDYYKDIEPVVESIRFSKEDSFYNSRMTVGPRN